MKLKLNLALLTGLLLSNLAQADLLFTVGTNASLWRATPSGQIDDDIKLGDKGLKLEETNGLQLGVFFEHPIPLLPNVAVKRTNIESTGNSKLTATFMDKTYDEDISSKLNLSHTDFTLYWGLPIPLPYLDFDFGLTGRNFNGQTKIEGKSSQRVSEVNLDVTLPMLYAGLKVSSPFGLYAKGNLNYIGFKDNTLTDYDVALGYELPIPVVDLGVELGYRAFKMKTDKKTAKLDTDVNLAGAYFGVSAAIGF